ncbi:MAG: hypothetical protein HRU09_20995 [Oligoflexales bacterium]|nr:hypothetical protein [Oligoflexales bacterium]
MEEICKGFPLSEFTKSETAARLNINNNPSKYFKRNMQTFCPVIEYLDKVSRGRLEITSGYRSSQLNFYADGVNNSYHTIGLALDIKPGIPFHIAEKIIANIDPSITTIHYDGHIHMHKESRDRSYEAANYKSELPISSGYTHGYQVASLLLGLVIVAFAVAGVMVKFVYPMSYSTTKH